MDDLEHQTVLDQLIRIEGSSLACYWDSSARLSVTGDDGPSPLPGVAILQTNVRMIASELIERWPVVSKLDRVRRRVVFHMAFNLGVTGLMAMPRFVAAVAFRFWDTAAEEMLITPWAEQNTRRAVVLAAMMRSGWDEILDVSQPRSAKRRLDNIL